MYLVQFPYDPMLVQMLKNNIPGAGRRWDNNNKMWQVDTQYESVIKQLFPNERVPVATQAQVKLETRVIDLRYLGQVKDRGNDEFTAFGYSNREWSVIFSEAVLRSWFEGFSDAPAPGSMTTLYGVLGLTRNATSAEIKPAYHRMARQWHPDICREPNASEVFLRIKEAYDVLSDLKKKSRYDVGLAFAVQQEQQDKNIKAIADAVCVTYRAPLRCGYVLVEGTESIGRFQVKTILAWEDIVCQGKTLVSSWIMGDNAPTEAWV
jgi:hypothetical protein